MLVGGDTVIKGLTPPLSISVAPRGIVLPAWLNPEFDPDVESGEAVPVEDTVGDAQLDVEATDPAGLYPPPSNVEFVSLTLEPLLVDEQFALGAGLKPPGLISVAPNGMPVPA